MAADPLRLIARLVGFVLLLLFGLLFWMLHSSLPLAAKLAGNRHGPDSPSPSSRSTHAASKAPLLPGKLSEAQVLTETLGPEGRAALRQDLNGDGVDELLALIPAGSAPGTAMERAVVLLRDAGGWRTVFDTADAATWSLPLTSLPAARASLHLATDANPAEALSRWRPLRVDATTLERITVEPLAPGGQPSGAVYTFKWDGWFARYEPSLKAAQPTEGALTPSPTVPKIDARSSGG